MMDDDDHFFGSTGEALIFWAIVGLLLWWGVIAVGVRAFRAIT